MNPGDTAPASRRKQRREGALLMLVSAAFVAAGAFMWFGEGQVMGLASMIFFGACFLGGIMFLAGPESAVGFRLAAVAALVMAAGCGLLAFLLLADPGAAPPGRSAGIGVVAGLVGLVFFGGGGVLLLVRAVRRASSR